MSSQVASPWDGHSSWSMRGGLHPRAQHRAGKGTEGSGAASSSWSSEWLMICAEGRTNPALQRDANPACCARRGCAAVISGSSRSPLVDCAFKVSPSTTQSTAEPAACAAELQLHIATRALPSVPEGQLGRSPLLVRAAEISSGCPDPGGTNSL